MGVRGDLAGETAQLPARFAPRCLRAPLPSSPHLLDALVIGAGPAGLTAAIYLARFRRSFLVLHDGSSRARWIPRTHNHPGFPGGVGGRALLGRLRRQAEGFGAPIVEGKVARVTPRKGEGGYFEVRGEGFAHRARTVLLATGVRDNLPPLPGVEAAIARGVVRICPICDAFEAKGRRIAVLGDGPVGAAEAVFLRRYSPHVTLLHVGAPELLTAAQRRALADAGIGLAECALSEIRLGRTGVVLTRAAGSDLAFDTLYSALGCGARSELGEAAGVALNAQGYLVAGQLHQETATPGLYAAGDVVRGLNQISVAEAEAAIAATAMHNLLREQDEEVL